MTELERYQEAVAPLRQADFGLVKEALGMVAEMSPTMTLIRITVENLLEIFEGNDLPLPSEIDPLEMIGIYSTNATCEVESFQYYCKNCDLVYVRESDRLKRCPKCNWKRGFGLSNDAD